MIELGKYALDVVSKLNVWLNKPLSLILFNTLLGQLYSKTCVCCLWGSPPHRLCQVQRFMIGENLRDWTNRIFIYGLTLLQGLCLLLKGGCWALKLVI